MKKETSLIDKLVSFLFFLKELSHIFRILSPLIYQLLHIGRQLRIESYCLLGSRMHKPESLGMKGLTRQELEAIFYELPVLGVNRALAYLRTIITLIIEKRMAYIVEMHTNLMSPSCLEPALHHCDITESFQNTVVSHGMLAVITLRKDLEAHPVIGVTTYITNDSTLIFLDITPDNSHITAFYRMDEELFGKIQLRLIVLGNNEKT